MKSRLIVSIITVVLVVLSVSLLYAQDEELTLDGIAGQLSALTERVAEMFTAQTDLTHRLGNRRNSHCSHTDAHCHCYANTGPRCPKTPIWGY